MKTALAIVQKYHPNVTRVVDAKKDIDIEVTEADTRRAKKKSPSTCALAKAFCRTFDGAIISITRAYLIKGTVAIRYCVPQAVTRELVSFDRNHEFAPGVYSLSAPGKHEKLGPLNRRLRKDRNKKRYPDVKRRSHRTTGIRSL